MTRRIVCFVKKDGRRYLAEEFNGDKAEFERLEKLFGKGQDSCDANWDEIISCFSRVHSYTDFIKANIRAQAKYHSFLSAGELGRVVHNLPRNHVFPNADEVYFILETEETEHPMMFVSGMLAIASSDSPKGGNSKCNFRKYGDMSEVLFSYGLICVQERADDAVEIRNVVFDNAVIVLRKELLDACGTGMDLNEKVGKILSEQIATGLLAFKKGAYRKI